MFKSSTSSASSVKMASLKTKGHTNWIIFSIIVSLLQSFCYCYPTFGGLPGAGGPPKADYTAPPPYHVQQPPVYPPKSQYNYPPPPPASPVYPAEAPKPAVLYMDQPPQYYPESSLYGVGGQPSSTTEAPSGIWKIFSIFSWPDFLSKKPEDIQSPPPPQPQPSSTYYANSPANYGSAPIDPSAYYNYALVQQQMPPSKYPLYQVVAPPSGNKLPKYPTTYIRTPQSYYSQPINSYLHRPSTVKPTTGKLTVPVTQYPPTTIKSSYTPAQAHSVYLVPAKPSTANLHPGYDTYVQQPEGAAGSGYRQPNPYNYYQFAPPQQQGYLQPSPYINYPQVGGYHRWVPTQTPTTTTRKPDCANASSSAAAAVTSHAEIATTKVPVLKTTTAESSNVHFIDARQNEIQGTTGQNLEDAVTSPPSIRGTPQGRNLLATKDNSWVPII